MTIDMICDLMNLAINLSGCVVQPVFNESVDVVVQRATGLLAGVEDRLPPWGEIYRGESVYTSRLSDFNLFFCR